MAVHASFWGMNHLTSVIGRRASMTGRRLLPGPLHTRLDTLQAVLRLMKCFCEPMIESGTFWKIHQEEPHHMNRIKHLPCENVVGRAGEISLDAGLPLGLATPKSDYFPRLKHGLPVEIPQAVLAEISWLEGNFDFFYRCF
jgi:hypothetical protein